MKEIETKIYAPHQEEAKRLAGISVYKGQRKAVDVYVDIKESLYKLIDEKTKESIGYISINRELKELNIPIGTLVAYCYTGAEAYRVSVSVVENSDKYTNLLSMKVWGLEESLSIQSILTKILVY